LYTSDGGKIFTDFLTRDESIIMHPFDKFITIEANMAGLLVNTVGAALRSSLSECGFCVSCGEKIYKCSKPVLNHGGKTCVTFKLLCSIKKYLLADI
jgi:hypothetical protein